MLQHLLEFLTHGGWHHLLLFPEHFKTTLWANHLMGITTDLFWNEASVKETLSQLSVTPHLTVMLSSVPTHPCSQARDSTGLSSQGTGFRDLRAGARTSACLTEVPAPAAGKNSLLSALCPRCPPPP